MPADALRHQTIMHACRLCRRRNPRKKSPRLNPSWLKWPGFEKGSEDTPGFLVVFFIAPDSTEMDINFRFSVLPVAGNALCF